jgi:excisionase family DNA binding protein
MKPFTLDEATRKRIRENREEQCKYDEALLASAVREVSPILSANDSNPQPDEMAVDTIYTLEEAAEKLKMSVRNVRQWVNDGKIKAFKLGREWRIHEEDLQAVIDNARKG